MGETPAKRLRIARESQQIARESLAYLCQGLAVLRGNTRLSVARRGRWEGAACGYYVGPTVSIDVKPALLTRTKYNLSLHRALGKESQANFLSRKQPNSSLTVPPTGNRAARTQPKVR